MREAIMSAFTVLFFGLLFLASNHIICQATSNMRCNEKELEALIELKNDFIDYNYRLSSWGADEDCCNWSGVVCSNSTNHVTQLHLQNPLAFDFYGTDAEHEAYEMSMLGGKINPSLQKLKYLFHLDLSGNSFTEIPPFLGSITTLRYLNLSNCMFKGSFPPQLGNLTNLQFLDLGANIYLDVENLQWLANLSSVEFLDLSFLNVVKSFDWLQVISNALPKLSQLRLSDCNLQNIPSVPVNFSSLSVLVLSYNLFNEILIPDWVFSLENLVFVDLSFNGFEGPIPIGFQNMTSLKHLNLRNNFFNSSLPSWLYSFKSLEYLDLRSNRLQGKISNSIANLTVLNSLILSGNNFQLDGDFLRSIEHLCNLRQIGLSHIKLSQHVSDVFQSFSTCIFKELEILDLASSQLFGEFKDDDLESFKNLIMLDLSCNSISGRLPTSVGQLSSSKYIDVSYNSFHGSISTSHFDNLSLLMYFYANENQLDFSIHSNWVPPFQLNELGMGLWHLGPRFPRWLRSQEYLKVVNMSNSNIFDAIPSWFWNFSTQLFNMNLSHNQIFGELPNLRNFPSIRVIDLSSNHLSGQLPPVGSIVYGLDLYNNLLSGSLSHFLCHQMNETMEMEILKLGNNFFSGEIPDCLRKWQGLNVLEVCNNNFIGSIPNSIGDLRSLQLLQLRNNSFSGILPPSLKGCTKLLNLDLAGNQFGGDFQTWIGESLQNLVFLNLRDNKFRGSIPEEICQLTSLRILDVSNNNFSGPIPKCVSNFTAMFSTNHSNDHLLSDSDQYMEVMKVMLIMMKGTMLEYSSTLNFLRIIDMSRNSLSGNIPPGLTKLKQLQSLNLSYNLLTGRVPQEIGAMRALECLDLCENQLSGEIPRSISDLNFLSRLNLSNNDLEGPIPTGTQLQSFDASSFSGNKLCGPPLTTSCNKSVETSGMVDDEGKSDRGFEVKWFYIGMAYGFGAGFWIVLGSLMIVKKWRHFYFQWIDRMWFRVRCGCM